MMLHVYNLDRVKIRLFDYSEYLLRKRWTVFYRIKFKFKSTVPQLTKIRDGLIVALVQLYDLNWNMDFNLNQIL
jgi:hypothetical protein